MEYTVDGDVVTLTGQVIRPTLKTDAEAALKRIERVSRIVNNIEVLPLSSADNWIRCRPTGRSITRTARWRAMARAPFRRFTFW